MKGAPTDSSSEMPCRPVPAETVVGKGAELYEGTNAVFQQPWWLDAVASGCWGAVEKKRDNVIRARMPYVIRKRFGFTVISMPPLTQTLGPWIAPSQAKYARQLAQQKELMTQLIEQLPPFDFFLQNFHYSITNWLPFYWRGFSQTTLYTYVIDDLTDLNRIWSEMTESTRRNIRKAQMRLIIRTDLGVDRFLDMNNLTFQRQGRGMPYDRALVRRLDAACAERQARTILFAEDAEGQVHAAVYIIHDKHTSYYLMGGLNPALTQSGATSLLMWRAIQMAAERGQSFNFEGSMIESIEHFFRNFGAKQKPYSQITKSNSIALSIYRSARLRTEGGRLRERANPTLKIATGSGGCRARGCQRPRPDDPRQTFRRG